MIYKVPLTITFDGYAVIKAKDEEHAEYIARDNLRANLGTISDNCNSDILHFEFDLHGDTFLRDNESPEECLDWQDVFNDIQEVKKIIKDLTFEEAAKRLAGFNADDELFDFNFGAFEGTITNNQNKPELSDNFDIYYSDGTLAEEGLSEDEVYEKMIEGGL